MNIHRTLYATLAAAALAGCGGAASPVPTTGMPTPTIAAAVIAPTSPIESLPLAAPSPTPTPPPATAGPTAGASAQASAAAQTFSYLWPAYLPDGMRISPNESRVARANEVGTTGTGFYLVTWNGDNRKLVVGGGATDTLPLAGETREVQYDNAPASLTVSGDQMQLVFVRETAKFFVYGRGISEDELLLVAESMVPTDPANILAQIEQQ